MAKVSIYVTDELKARMDRAGELNWSATAQRAFEIELNLVEWKMAENEEDMVVARLRASKAKVDERNTTEGRVAGQRWARNYAEFDELERVAALEIPNEAWVEENAEARILACTIMDVDDYREIDHSDYLWEKLCDRNVPPSAGWIAGFLEGATEVWDEVASKV